MKTITILTALLISLAGFNLMAAPPPKVDGEDIYQVRFELIYNEGAIGTVVETGLDEAIPAGKRLMVRNVNYGFNLPSPQTGSCQLVGTNGENQFHLPSPTAWSAFVLGERFGYGNVMSDFVMEEGDFIVGCYRSGATGLGSVVVTVTGVLLSAP